MARVFLSYRRADGQYAVGWIAERLARLPSEQDVQVAFRDGNLRGGDDFPAALARQVAECDILIAVIGPNWLGRGGADGRRVLDPMDWVGREISAALEQEKVIIPVLVDGAEPVGADQLAPEHQSFADLHALQFRDEEDLIELVRDVESHLDELDRERARTAGLAERIVVPPVRPQPWVVLVALISGAVGVGAGWLLANAVGSNSSDDWERAVMVQLGFAGTGGALGVWYFARHLHTLVRVRWRPVVATLAVFLGIVVWGSAQYGTLFQGDDTATILVALLTMGMLGPWIIAAVGSLWTEPLGDSRGVRDRTLIIAELGRSGLISCGLLAVVSVPPIVTAAAALERQGQGKGQAVGTLITYGAFLTLVIGFVLVYGRTRLERQSLALTSGITDLAAPYRRHVAEHMVDEPVGRGARWVVLPLLVPLVAGVVMAIIYEPDAPPAESTGDSAESAQPLGDELDDALGVGGVPELDVLLD